MSEIKVSVGLVLSETLGEESVLGRSPCLDADGCFLPVSSLLFHVCLCLCPSVLFLEGHLSSWIKALVTSFYLSCLFKGSVSNCSHLMRHWELRANIWVLRQNSGHNKWRQYLFPTIISFSIAKTQSSTLLSSPSPADPICGLITRFFCKEITTRSDECYSCPWFSRIICGFFVLFSFFCYRYNLNEETPKGFRAIR